MKKKCGILLSGGGLRGFGGLALYEFCNDNDITPDLLIGCSGGALVAALWNLGYSPKQSQDLIDLSFLERNSRNLDLMTFLTFFTNPFGNFNRSRAILKADSLKERLKKLLSNIDVADLKIPALFQTTDVETGKGVTLAEGALYEVVYASMALLPFLPAQLIGKRWLVDGSFATPIPIFEALKHDIDVIIVFNCEMETPEEPDSFMPFYSNFVNLAANQTQRSEMLQAIDMHHDEIIIINVRAKGLQGSFGENELEKIIEDARDGVSRKKEHILASLGF